MDLLQQLNPLDFESEGFGVHLRAHFGDELSRPRSGGINGGWDGRAKPYVNPQKNPGERGTSGQDGER